MQQKRNPMYFIVIIIALFFIFNPFGKKEQRAVPVDLPEADEILLENLIGGIKNNHQSPGQYVISLFKDNQYVLLGEFPGGNVKQHLLFLQGIVPELYNSGIRNIAVEFAKSGDQRKLDAVLTADQYIEKDVEEILFNYMSIWGYQEYANVFKAVHLHNSGLSSGAEPMRIIGISPDLKYEHIITEEDLDDDKILALVHGDRSLDQSMAYNVLNILKDEKALVYARFAHSFTQYHSSIYEEKIESIGLSDSRYMGEIIEASADAATVLLHSPWIDSTIDSGIAHPVNGVFDNLLAKIDEQYQYAGFSVSRAPFSGIEILNKDILEERTSLRLMDICDGYLLLGKMADYSAGGPIPDFITEENLEETKRRFPGPKEGLERVRVKDLNEFIATNVKQLNTLLSKFN